MRISSDFLMHSVKTSRRLAKVWGVNLALCRWMNVSKNGIYWSLQSGRELHLKAKNKAKDWRPRPRPRPLLFVLQGPRKRGQVLEDISLADRAHFWSRPSGHPSYMYGNRTQKPKSAENWKLVWTFPWDGVTGVPILSSKGLLSQSDWTSKAPENDAYFA